MQDADKRVADHDREAAAAQRGPAERHLAVQYAVSLVLAESPSLDDAAPRLLQAIGEELEWEVGTLWRVDRPANLLRYAAAWSKPTEPSEPTDAEGTFERASKQTTFAPDVGLPGRAWARNEPAWIADVLVDANFPRLEPAAAAGLRGAVAFPVRGAGGVLSVFEFFSRELQPPDKELIRTLAALGNQIGQFVERKRAEESVRESEARKAAILGAALDAIVTIDHEGRVTEFNPAAEHIFGYRRAEALGRQIGDLIIPRSLRDAHYQGLARYLETGEGALIGRRVETTAMRADGAEFPAELAITRIQIDGPPMFTGHIRDITERKRIEAALRDSEQRLRTVIDNAPIILFAFDRVGIVKLAEGRGLAAMGLAQDAVVGHSAFELFKNVPHSLDHLHRALTGESFTSIDDMNGPVFETWWMPLNTEDGEVSGAIGVATDITERARAVRLRDDFLTLASHDLRSPLTSVLGRIDLLEMRLNGGAPLDETWLRALITALRGAASRILATVQEIADAAQMQIGETLTLHMEPLDLSAMVRAVTEATGAQEDATLVRVETPGGVIVEGDRTRLERVVQNLVDNAVKYSPQQTPVDVSVDKQEDWAIITIHDSGVGIPVEDLPHIFTPFYRASTAMGVKGSGIGLAGAKSIVEQHGGRIDVASSVGVGTTVTVRLPRQP